MGRSPTASLDAGEYEEHALEEYFDESDYGEWSSDDELDWDPDRERLLRLVRQSASGSSRQYTYTAEADAIPAKTLADRRNEWRASRGLERQKTVAELVAERRERRTGPPVQPSSTPSAPPSAPASTPSSSAGVGGRPPTINDDGILDLSEGIGRALQLHGGDDLITSGRSGKMKQKRSWPWRPR